MIHKNKKDKKLYKIFDNRFYPTYRRPCQWEETLPWSSKLGVQKKFEFKESDDVDELGRPSEKEDESRKRKHSPLLTPYPKGSILVIEYNFVNGTHYASRASHFRDIVERIFEMHNYSEKGEQGEQGLVHGDIRGFNMLHPHPEDNEVEGGIKKSLLIDFDLSGKPNRDKYPPGYSEIVSDNAFGRSGKAGEVLKKSDDWADLAGVMSQYQLKAKPSGMELDEYLAAVAEWKNIRKKFKNGECEEGRKSLSDFVETFDYEIEIDELKRKELEKFECKGTGSPVKRQQKPRGRLTVSDPT